MCKTMSKGIGKKINDYIFNGSDEENSSFRNDSEEDSAEETSSDRKEGEYVDPLKSFKEQLVLLEEGKHPEYRAKLQKIELMCSDRKFRSQVLFDFRKEEISKEYEKEIEASEKDFLDEKNKITDRLLSELEEKRRILEAEKNSVDLTFSGDVLEQKPTSTRKLRRRGAYDNDYSYGDGLLGGLALSCETGLRGSSSAAVLSGLTASPSLVSNMGICVTGGISTVAGSVRGAVDLETGSTTGIIGSISGKKRKQAAPLSWTQINMLLSEADIYADLIQMNRACGKPVSRKSATAGGLWSEDGEKPSRSVWIDDGRLYCGHKCYQQGMHVVVDAKEGPGVKCSGTITSVGLQEVVIRRSSDSGAIRITIHQLKSGKYSLQSR